MDAFLANLQRWDLHPVADHFTIGLLIVGVLLDLIASLAPTRTWLRYTALMLMILGAFAAGASYFTGDMEADRELASLEQGVAWRLDERQGRRIADDALAWCNGLI